MKKVLLVRLDKIGDLICTLPTDQVLDESVYDITWVVQKGLGQILDLAEKKRKYIELDKNNIQQSKEKFSHFLKKENFDIAVSFQCPWWVNFEIFKSKIKKRIGVFSQWHSFLFLNEGIRQKRSQSIQHEFDYNLDLIKKITGPLNIENSDILFKFKKPDSSEIINKYDLGSGEYIVVHPGMMGSALNWPQQKYIDYIHQLINIGKKIVITGTDADMPYLLKIQNEFKNNPSVTWLQSKLNIKELIQVLYYSEKVIAPSTGVAHIAASLGKNVFCIFSPIKVHRATRWAPRGKNVHAFQPKINNNLILCPSKKNCFKEKCSYYNCMEKINL